MKKALTLAALLVAFNMASVAARAGGLSDHSVTSVSDSLKAIAHSGEVLSAGSVKFSKDGYDLSKEAVHGTIAFSGTSAQKTWEGSKSASASTSGSLSAAGAYTVEKVESGSTKSAHVIKVSFKSVKDNTILVATFSYNSSSAVGKAMIESASTLLVFGKGVILATSQSGVVLVTESAQGIEQVLEGNIKAGSSTIIASTWEASKAFGSKIVETMKKK